MSASISKTANSKSIRYRSFGALQEGRQKLASISCTLACQSALDDTCQCLGVVAAHSLQTCAG